MTWKATHRHHKSGGDYMLIGEGRIEATMAPCMIYQAASGQLWVRPSKEFRERFGVISEFPAPAVTMVAEDDRPVTFATTEEGRR